MMAEPKPRHSSIAVVDDDTRLLISLERNLKIAGFEVKTFASAEAYLGQQPFSLPDLLLVDLRMPGMSGIELRLLLNRRGMHTPTIFMTGHGQQETVREMELAGSSECLRKPFKAKELKTAI